MNKSSKKTMLLSVIMSTPGVLVVGIGLLIGKSNTQLADFIRRSIELVAIVLSFIVFCIISKDNYQDLKKKAFFEKSVNIFVGIIMIICGIIMFILALTAKNTEKGNVIPGLCVAILGVIANSFFWFKYKKISKETNNLIVLAQSNLYRAKTFVDCSVTIALFVVLISSNQNVSYYFDLVGTISVAIYLAYSGIITLINKNKQL